MSKKQETIASATDTARRKRSDWLLILLIISTMFVSVSNIVMYHRIFTITELDTLKPPAPISLAKLYNTTQMKSSLRETEKIYLHPPYYSSSLLKTNSSSKLAGLSCIKHGGPSDEFANHEMVYWSDIPADSEYKSPFYDPEKYVTFEPDHGGWNNIRMGMLRMNMLTLFMRIWK